MPGSARHRWHRVAGSTALLDVNEYVKVQPDLQTSLQHLLGVGWVSGGVADTP